MAFPQRWLLLGLAIALPALSAQTTTLNLSTDLITLGIATANLAPNQPTLDSGPLLEAAVKYASSHNYTQIVASPGSYYFLSGSQASAGTHVLLSGVTAALTIDFQGSDLYFSHPEKQKIFLANDANLTLQNFTMDDVQQRYTQLLVTSVNAATGQIQFTVQPGWQNPSALAALLPTLDPSGAAVTSIFVFRNGQPWVGYTTLPVQLPLTDTALTLTSATTPAAAGAIQPGDIAVLNLRAGGVGLLATGCTGCTFRNIKIYAGLVGFRSTGLASSLLERVEVMPRPGTDRLVSTMADGISPSQSGPNNVLRLCRAIRTLDDGFSPNTYVFASVQGVLGTRSLQVQGDASTALNASYALPNGADVIFQSGTDGSTLGAAVVVSQASAPAVGGLPQLVLNFDRDLPTNLLGTYIYSTDPSWRSGNLLLERNTAQQGGWARGMSLWGLMNATLYGNYVHRSVMGGIGVENTLNAGNWVTPPNVNLTLLNNVIDGTVLAPDIHSQIELGAFQAIARSNAGGPFATAPHQNLALTGNFLADTGRTALWIGNTTGGVADRNYLFDPNNRLNPASAYPAFAAQEQQPLVVENAPSVSLGTNPVDRASGRAFVTNTGFQELAAYAPGSTVRLNAYNLGTLPAPTISLSDADGQSWSLGLAATATHSLDVTLPAGVGLGAAVITVQAGNVTYFGTLFLDSQDNGPALNQATYLISPSATVVPAAGATVPVLVVTQAGQAYSVTDPDAFVAAGNPAPGTGLISLTLAKNTGSARTTTVVIAGQPITLTQAGASDPVIATPPSSQTVSSGTAAVFTASMTGAQSYQWYFNGAAIAGATASTYTVSGATSANAGTYSVVATNASGSATSPGALLSITNSPPISRLANLSILTTLSAASPLLTMGTVVGGSGTAGTKALLIRAAGPSLGALGVPGTISDPELSVYSGPTVVAANDNWGGTSALLTAFAEVGAFPFISATSTDAAVYSYALQGGGYSVQVTGVNGAAGTVIAEIYDSTPAGQFTALTPRLINVSVLKTLAAGETLTAGFVIEGTASKQVLVRADGPALALAPFYQPGVMANPAIALYSNGNVIASNDDWGTPVGPGAATATQLNAAFAQVGAFALPLGSQDAAILVTLPPGLYSAQVSGVNGSAGQAIVEVYEVP